MKRLVAFCGSKESGKSTSSEIFRTMVTRATKEVAFAGHLKEVCSKVFDIPIIHFLDTKLKEKEFDNYAHLSHDKILKIFELFEVDDKYDFDQHVRHHMGQVFDTPRKLLQYVGTELLHPIDKLIHVNITLKKIDMEAINLVTDLRFAQEFDALVDREDFLPIYVSNSRAENAAAADTHASEQGWKIFKDRCFVLDNNGDLNNLRVQIQSIVDTFCKETQ